MNCDVYPIGRYITRFKASKIMKNNQGAHIDIDNYEWNTGEIFSMVPGRRTGCAGKRKLSYPEAVKIKDNYRNRVAITFGSFTVYYCPLHETWHVGHFGKRRSELQAYDRMFERIFSDRK